MGYCKHSSKSCGFAIVDMPMMEYFLVLKRALTRLLSWQILEMFNIDFDFGPLLHFT